MSKIEQEFMKHKIESLLEDGSIKQVTCPHKKGWLSNVFLVPKQDGAFEQIHQISEI